MVQTHHEGGMPGHGVGGRPRPSFRTDGAISATALFPPPPTPAPTPILKSAAAASSGGSSSRKRGGRQAKMTPSSLSFSMNFSREASARREPPPTVAEEMDEAKEPEETDTDVGSRGDDDDDDDAWFGASPPPSVSRVGAKVRRLNLGDEDATDVKTSLARHAYNRAGEPTAGGAPSSPPAGRAPSSPSRGPSGYAPPCPPSTVKRGRGHASRLFGGAEEDVSPRDAAAFPFFDERGGGGNSRAGNAIRAPPARAPPAFQKPHRRVMDPNAPSVPASSPLGRPRMVGRANSFLQMFSQESLPEDIDKKDGSEDMDEKENDDEEFDDFLRRPMSGQDAGDHTAGDFRLALPLEERPVRGNAAPAPDPSSFSRFAADFEVVDSLGTGAFGTVCSVRHRADRRMYAIKAARREARGASDRDRMLREARALAALADAAGSGGTHVVRYHQAWMEGSRLYIQTELCTSTLREEMGAKGGALMGGRRRYKLLREMLLALELVHRSGMVHLDIKPENIFIKNDQYKLGDFGLVSKIENHDDVEEGDSRYMSMELLSGDLDDLTKSDIFSLGATAYEICLLPIDGRPPRSLPENGPEWRDIRDGVLLPTPGAAPDLRVIVREMMAPRPRGRPSAEELLRRRRLLSDEQRQLIVERNKANAATTALDAQMQRFKLLSPRKLNRSNTIS